jgi:hypothetical protein
MIDVASAGFYRISRLTAVDILTTTPGMNLNFKHFKIISLLALFVNNGRVAGTKILTLLLNYN